MPEREERAAGLEKEIRLLQSMLDTTHAQLAYLDRQFNFVAVNAAYARGCGYTREELIGRNHFDLFPHAENQIIFARVRDTGEPAVHEAKPFVYAHRPELGTTYWDWTLRPVKDEHGAVEGLLLSLVDVTERERTRAERERLNAILESTPDFVATFTLDGRVSHLNRAAKRILGAQEGALPAGFDLADLHPAWAVELLRQEGIPTALRNGAWQGETALRGSSGGEIPVSQVLIAHRSADGAVEYLSTIARDLSERIEAQRRLDEEARRHAAELEALVAQRTARLQASEARFRSIFEEAPIGIALADLSGRIRHTNPAWRQILRCTEGNPAGRTLDALLASGESAAGEPLLAALVAGRRRRLRTELRLARPDGRIAWAGLTACLVHVPRGRRRFVLAMLEDISERKEAAAALLQAEKLAMAGRLAASLTHEINNPLQSVLGCLGLAQEALAAGESAGRFLEVALEELRRAAAIVSRLRDLQRRSPREDRAPADLEALLEQVLTLTAKQCADRRIEVLRQAEPGLPPVPVVADHIRQVFLNLVLNAIEAMPRGGRLRVHLAATGEPAGVSVTIADSGTGMAPEVVGRLYEPFFSTKPDGLGLGLHVSRNIVQDHGGRIDVESEKGRGTTFTIWLPGH